MRTKLAKITSSLMILLGGLVVIGLCTATVSYSDPPGPPPWQSDPVFLLPLAFLPVLWLAAKPWYSLPVFFGYGAFIMLPFAWAVCGPQTHHGFPSPVPPSAAVETLALCCGSGVVAAFTGFLSCRARPTTTRRA